ncbi:hypothetical protein [Nonomuraea dietziae]|uniref:hypothetical protein n=1 Tax=Nonomuraea dietziae TaxID=65515 RepID=UPI003438243C
MIHPTGLPTFEVAGRLHLDGHAEFLGIRRHIDRPPTASLRVLGIELEFTSTNEADAFARQAVILAEQLHLAHERAEIAREPKTEAQVQP